MIFGESWFYWGHRSIWWDTPGQFTAQAVTQAASIGLYRPWLDETVRVQLLKERFCAHTRWANAHLSLDICIRRSACLAASEDAESCGQRLRSVSRTRVSMRTPA